nr:MAG TPA: hypothetical protein [Caudoviricetes sp.]
MPPRPYIYYITLFLVHSQQQYYTMFSTYSCAYFTLELDLFV